MKNFLAVFDTKDNNCYAFSFIFFVVVVAGEHVYGFNEAANDKLG